MHCFLQTVFGSLKLQHLQLAPVDGKKDYLQRIASPLYQ